MQKIKQLFLLFKILGFINKKYIIFSISDQSVEYPKILSCHTKLLSLEGLYSNFSKILTGRTSVWNFQGGIRNSPISEEKANLSSILQWISQWCLSSMLIWFKHHLWGEVYDQQDEKSFLLKIGVWKWVSRNYSQGVLERKFFSPWIKVRVGL